MRQNQTLCLARNRLIELPKSHTPRLTTDRYSERVWQKCRCSLVNCYGGM